MYRDVPYQRFPMDEIEAMIAEESARWPSASRIFLADGDVTRRPFAELRQILVRLNQHFPRLARVGTYANGSSIYAKTTDELEALRSLKLHTLYMGLESGSDRVLAACRKGETAAQMVDAGARAQAAGLRMSVMVLLGLGGAALSGDHTTATVAALNRMQPRLLSVLRMIPLPGTELHDDVRAGLFQQLTEYEAVCELRDLLAGLALNGTVFRANHSSNIVPLEGRLPRDRARLVADVSALLGSDTLDKDTPGPMPLWL